MLVDAIDVKLELVNGFYDIDFQDDGEFVLEDSFATCINIALLTDERADSKEVLLPQLRRGWWGKLINNKDNPDLPYGSKLWLLTGRNTIKKKNDGVDYANKCLQGMVALGELKNVNAVGTLGTNGITIDVTLVRFNDKPETLNYNLWNNTR
jgi:phage gp46-like protein